MSSQLRARTEALLRGALKHTSTAALAAALVPLGALATQEARATTSGGIVNVTGTATPENGNFRYSYTINYTATDDVVPLAQPGFGPVTDFYLPFFDDAETSFVAVGGVPQIFAPAGWDVEFENNVGQWQYESSTDPDAGTYDAPAVEFEDPPFVLHYFVLFDGASEISVLAIGDAVDPGESLGGFEFLSPFGPQNGPVLVGFELVDPPLPDTPNSPFVDQEPGAVPEPLTAGTLAMAGVALVSCLARRRR